MMKTLALSAIGFYQRHLSPYKGFRCAYCAYTDNASCSHLGARAIRRFGVWNGLGVLKRRLDKCGVAYRRYRPEAERSSAPRRLVGRHQAGFCDLPCDAPGECPCDLSFKGAGKVCDVLSCGADCCDWSRKKKKRENDELLYIPPRSDRRNRR